MTKIIRKCILIFMTFGLISCGNDELIEPLIKQNVVLASGFNWSTGKIVSINPFTSDAANSCNFKGIFIDSTKPTETKDNDKLKNGKCIQVVGTGASEDALLRDALSISASPFNGTIRVNGENKDAKFLVTVTALYEGSHCATIFSGGQQLQNCINVEAYCQALASYGLSC